MSVEDVVQLAQAVQIDVDDCGIGAHSESDLGCINTNDAAANDCDLRRCHSGNAPEQNASSPLFMLKIAGANLDRHASSNLGHWREQGQGAVPIRDRLVGNAHHLLLK